MGFGGWGWGRWGGVSINGGASIFLASYTEWPARPIGRWPLAWVNHSRGWPAWPSMAWRIHRPRRLRPQGPGGFKSLCQDYPVDPARPERRSGDQHTRCDQIGHMRTPGPPGRDPPAPPYHHSQARRKDLRKPWGRAGAGGGRDVPWPAMAGHGRPLQMPLKY
jgi:hypothetical protein